MSRCRPSCDLYPYQVCGVVGFRQIRQSSMADSTEDPAVPAAQRAAASREFPQCQAKGAPPPTAETSSGHQLQQSASTSTSTTSKRSNKNSNGTSSNGADGPGALSTLFESIDDVVQAIQSIPAIAAGDAMMQYKLARESLLPALMHLEQKGISAGVPGNVILQSPLSGNLDPLQLLMQQPDLTGNGIGYLFILCVQTRRPTQSRLSKASETDAFVRTLL